jgi:hypothetical protein
MIVMVVVTVTKTINLTLLILRYPWSLYLLSHCDSRSFSRASLEAVLKTVTAVYIKK